MEDSGSEEFTPFLKGVKLRKKRGEGMARLISQASREGQGRASDCDLTAFLSMFSPAELGEEEGDEEEEFEGEHREGEEDSFDDDFGEEEEEDEDDDGNSELGISKLKKRKRIVS